MTTTIYRIVHEETGAAYVGRTRRPRARWSEHKCRLRHGGHPCRGLQAIADAHGIASLRFERLETVEDSAAVEAEQRHIDAQSVCLNRIPADATAPREERFQSPCPVCGSEMLLTEAESRVRVTCSTACASVSVSEKLSGPRVTDEHRRETAKRARRRFKERALASGLRTDGKPRTGPARVYGDRNPNARAVEAIDDSGAVVGRWDAVVSAAAEVGVKPGTIYTCMRQGRRVRGLLWRKAA